MLFGEKVTFLSQYLLFSVTTTAPAIIVESVMVKIYTRWTKASKIGREVFMSHLLILEEVPKILPPEHSYIGEYIVSIAPRGKNAFP